MKGFVIPGLIALFIGSGLAAQTRSPQIEEMLKKDNSLAGINTQPYLVGKIYDTPAPKGYKPFYISHYGRHGSRSDWGIPYYEHLIGILEEAKSQQILTEEGQKLLDETKTVLELTNGMNGRLTQRGVREHQEIADRMFHRYKRVFSKGSRQINSFSSTSPRCIISMTAFTGKLIELDNRLKFTWDTGERFYDYIGSDCSQEMRQKTEPVLDSIRAAHPAEKDNDYTMNMIFSNREKADKLVRDIDRLERDIYETAKVEEGFDMDCNSFRFLTFDALFKWYDYYNMDLYLRQGNSVRYGLERMPNTRPLMDDVIAKADYAIRTGEIAADLRFGHDYTVISFAGYLGLEGVGDRLTIQEAQKTWCGGVNVCFAENIQMIFYKKSDKDPVLVKFLFNEEETLLRGLDSVEGPYYDWEYFKKNNKGYLR